MELIKLTIDYVKVQYDPTTRPLTSYPDKLTKHLIKVHDFKKNQKLLEVGVGRPDMLLGFKRFGLNVQGCDKSVESMRICQKNDIPFKLIDFSQKKLPYKTGTFDIVYSKSVIEHMVDPLKFIMECRRVLKPGGKILTLTPDWNANYLTFFDDFTHVRPMTRRSMELLLKVAKLMFIDLGSYLQPGTPQF